MIIMPKAFYISTKLNVKYANAISISGYQKFPHTTCLVCESVLLSSSQIESTKQIHYPESAVILASQSISYVGIILRMACVNRKNGNGNV